MSACRWPLVGPDGQPHGSCRFVFLDEGFGTLDEDALIRLAMLSTLRQRGKVIGLISHVQGLKDRMDTRNRCYP